MSNRVKVEQPQTFSHLKPFDDVIDWTPSPKQPIFPGLAPPQRGKIVAPSILVSGYRYKVWRNAVLPNAV